ncbi:hypothetical protein ACFL3G_04530 [Planctomycetota bacterium]
MQNNSFAKFVLLLLAAIVCACYLSFSALAADSNDVAISKTVKQPLPPAADPIRTPRQRMNSVKMADFYLRDGQLMFGKVVNEDKNKITIEQLDNSRLIVTTYSKREIDTRTLRIKKVPEHKYFAELAKYFAGRTWDFVDDPDDFIYAIRSYEKAKFSLTQIYDPNSEKIKDIDTQIQRLQADRQVWVREAKSRAELVDLEFQATIQTRLKELEDNVNKNMLQISRILEKLDRLAGELQTDGRNSSQRTKDTSRELDSLKERINDNRRSANRNDRDRRYYTKQKIKTKDEEN